jgi:hypothetical protein
MSPQVRQELQRLLSALCDGELTDTQHARLETLLDADLDCQHLYLEYLDMHARLLTRPHPAHENTEGRKPQEETVAPRSAGYCPAARRRRIPSLIRYLAVAGATLAASLLIQLCLRPQTPSGNRDNKPPHAAVIPSSSEYVATLTQTADCAWQNPADTRRAGSRLLPGELRLRKGIARIRFDSGADLVIEGPVDLRLDSGTSATVLRGKVVFRADEMSVPFDLHTPSATLVDLGTEYAVAVGPEGEEIHVFDGEVQRMPKSTTTKVETQHLTAGQGRRFGPDPDAPGQPATLEPASFVRQVSDKNNPQADPQAGLIAYEGFDYKDPALFFAGRANGGFGWTSNWMRGLTRPLNDGDHNLLVLDPKESLSRPGAAAPSVGGSFDYAGFAKYHRRLATPIRLHDDGVYYISFLFRRGGPSDDPVNAVAVLLRTSDELKKANDDPHKRLNIGVGGANQNQLFTHLGGIGSRTPLPLDYNQTYLLIAKIAAGDGDNPAQVFTRVYGQQESVDAEEPSSWTVVGPPFQSDLAFDWLEIHVNSKARQTIDELRVGTTWPSVTAPWIGPPGQK